MDNQQNIQNSAQDLGTQQPEGGYMEVKSNKRGFAVASLILGIVSVVCCCISYAGLAMAILAIIFAVVSKRKMGYFDPLAVAGLILGIVGTVFGATVVLVDVLSRFGYFGDLEDLFEEAMKQYEAEL